MNEDKREIIFCKLERLKAATLCTRVYYDEFDEPETRECHNNVYVMLRQLEDMIDEIFTIRAAPAVYAPSQEVLMLYPAVKALMPCVLCSKPRFRLLQACEPSPL